MTRTALVYTLVPYSSIQIYMRIVLAPMEGLADAHLRVLSRRREGMIG